MTDFLQVQTTVSSADEAQRLAGALVERRLAACVQVIGPVQSIYRWEGRVERAEEWLCLIKSPASRYDALQQAIRELHSYECPEIVAVPIERGSDDYLRWLAAETSADKTSADGPTP
jgi:periplasmic divalent cation tolerance protein